MQERVISLFNPLVQNFGPAAVLHYIQAQTDVAPIVVEQWITGKRTPSSGIQKAVFNCLKNARPEDFPQVREMPRVPVKTKQTPPSSRISRRTITRRESIIEHNEKELFAIRQSLRSRGLILEEVE